MEIGVPSSVIDSVTHGALIRVLTAAPLFRTLSEEEIAAIALKSERKTAERREGIGSLSDGVVYVMGRGRARLKRACGDRELTLEYMGPGDLFGEQQLFESKPDGEAVALDPTEVVAVPLDIVKKAARADPTFAMALLQSVASRRRAAEHRIHAMLSRDVESRVAEFILDAAAKYGVPDSRGVLVEFKFTHQEIADFVGSTRETVTLVMGAFKKSGVVVPDHRRALIKKLDVLRAKL